MIYAYQKQSDEFAIYTLRTDPGQPWCELATIGNTTYTWVDGPLPAQPEQISVTPVTQTPALVTALINQSRALQLILQRLGETAEARAEMRKLGVEVPEPAVRITPRQARLALLQEGLLEQVEQALGQMPQAAQIEWAFATAVERTSPLVAAAAQALQLTDAQLDDLFAQAAAL